MRFIQFNDKKIDSFLLMELSDLAKALSKVEELDVEFGFKSYYDPTNEKIIVSHFWDNRPYMHKVDGMKTDIYLRAIGSKKYTDFKEVSAYISGIKSFHIQSFAKQLFMLCEDIRLEELCKRERPGTKRAFETRRSIYRKYFNDQMQVNSVKSVHTDTLFNTIFLLLTTVSPNEDTPAFNEKISRVFPFVRNEIPTFFEANSTKDVIKSCMKVVEVLDEVLDEDLLNMYFHLPELEYDLLKTGINFDDLKRKNKLKNDDSLKDVKKDDEDIHKEKLPTWHQETSTPTKSFLQFDLEQGTKTNLLGAGAREGEAGDQSLGVVQGSSKQTSRNDYSKLEAMESRKKENAGNGNAEFGIHNKYAYLVQLQPKKPTQAEIAEYERNRTFILPYQKKLKNMILKTLDHKRILPRQDLHFGRLSKKLIRLLTQDNPRMFYKKNQSSPQLDAVFSLLVDCSASMYDKMQQTKLGIILFHEALKSLQVIHEITGFWEDTSEASELKQPNYLQSVIDFDSCLRHGSGPGIMQLQPEEDNRDGFAIRNQTIKLLRRSEKQKFLLVFSDGEPAAFGYEQNGIVDTHEAVLLARRLGVEVINVFLANGDIDEGQQKTVQHIYGKYSILVPNIEELHDYLFPLLKKLLLKAI